MIERTTLDAGLEAVRTYLIKDSAEIAQALFSLPDELLHELSMKFDLSPFEWSCLFFAAFADLDPEAPKLFAKHQGSNDFERPTVAFVLTNLEGAHWGALAPDRPLQKYGLVKLQGASALLSKSLVVPERVIFALTGVETMDQALLLLVEAVTPATPSIFHDKTNDELRKLLAMGKAPAIVMFGPDRQSLIDIASAAMGANNPIAKRQRLWLMRAGSVPAQHADRMKCQILFEREHLLSPCVVIIDAFGLSKEECKPATAFADLLNIPTIIISREPLALQVRVLHRLSVKALCSTDQYSLWQDIMQDAAPKLNGHLEKLAAHFSLPPARIKAIGSLATFQNEPEDIEGIGRALWASCREEARPLLADLAQKVETNATWDELVLPESQKEILRSVAAQVRSRQQVYESWGFADKSNRGLAINALFAGQSGVGKTMAAEVLGRELDLDVYRIDLSSIISKWIGETEKHLRRVFDAAENSGAILLFDESDALFGKRSEVKDSHDRHANIEVSYLLQRMETYRGLAILTTNLKNNIDDAFLRRIRFLVDFAFPSAHERAIIWRKVFPENTPLNDLDYDKLGQLSVTGGNIRNIAINAAFHAAEDGMAVSMQHVLKAALREYEKVGKTMSASESRGW